MSAFMPFFQLHGRANITPWTVPDHVDETVALYRYYAHLHHELVPFFYSLTRRGDAGGPTVIRPIGGEADWPDDWRFQVGEAFLIAPVFSPAPTRTVELPAGAALWPWAGAQDGPLAGGTTKSYDATQRGFIPAFLREGAIVPMHVDSDATGLGSKATATALTVLAVPSATTSSFELDDDDDAITTLTLGARAFTMSRALRSTYVRLWLVDTPTMVELDGTALTKVADRGALEAAPSGWFTTANGHEVWVKVPAKTSALALQW
jgi:alpha-glucosidase (family GH31 glycosyl hydrolase)